MEKDKKPLANSQEFVLLSIDGYRKLAGIDGTGKNLYWTTDINNEIPIKFKLNTDNYDILFPKTIPQCLFENLKNYPEDVCCHAEPTPGKWESWTWKQTWDI